MGDCTACCYGRHTIGFCHDDRTMSVIALHKHKRIRDQGLLDFVKTLPCIVCRTEPSDPDHVTSRGAGGDDVAMNVWALCRPHHVERHAKGLGHMVRTYPSCVIWLELAGRKDILERYQDAEI